MSPQEDLAKGVSSAIIGIGGLVNICLISITVERLHGPRAPLKALFTGESSARDDQEPFRRPSPRSIKLTIYIVLVGLILSFARIGMAIASLALLPVTPSVYFSDGGYRDPWSSMRILYAGMLANWLTKVCLLAALLTGNRLLLLPSTKTSTSRAKLSLVANVLQIAVSLILALVAWFMVFVWGLSNGLSIDAGRPQKAVDKDEQSKTSHVSRGNGYPSVNDQGKLDAAGYILLAFVSWFVLVAVGLVASVLRKIAHSRKDGLDGSVQRTERRILITFAKWVIPWLLIAVGLFVAEIFLSIFQSDVVWGGMIAQGVLDILSSLVGDWVGFGMSLWAAGKLIMILRPRSSSPDLLISGGQGVLPTSA